MKKNVNVKVVRGPKPLDEDNVCGCGVSGRVLHGCPFAEEINNNYDFKCNCCKKCTQKCLMAV